jgi:endonuclease G
VPPALSTVADGGFVPEAAEGLVLGPYRTFQIAITDLEVATGYGFGALKAADPLKKTEAGREAAGVGIPAIVPIEDTADLML